MTLQIERAHVGTDTQPKGTARKTLWLMLLLVTTLVAIGAGIALNTRTASPATSNHATYQEPNANTREGRVGVPVPGPNAYAREGHGDTGNSRVEP
jgi:hypothetical protein